MTSHARTTLRLVSCESSIPRYESSNRESDRVELRFPNDGSIQVLDAYATGLYKSVNALYAELRKIWGKEVFKSTKEHFFNMKARAKDEGYAAALGEDLLSFVQFARVVGPRPSPGYSIDRINNNLGYSADNVRWATKSEQARNRSSTLAFHIDGVRRTLDEASEISGEPRRRIRARRSAGLPDELAVFGSHRPSAVRLRNEFDPVKAYRWSKEDLQSALRVSKTLGFAAQRIAINELLRRMRAMQQRVEQVFVPEEFDPTKSQIAEMSSLAESIRDLQTLLIDSYPNAHYNFPNTTTGYVE
jgi:hypothetical protein